MILHELCQNAIHAGRGLDLTGCDYGPHKRTNQHLGIQPYYYFLAGMVSSLGLKRILEIGTSYGGSIMAMERGCGKETSGAKFVTVDKVDIAGEALLSRQHIARLHGDSLDQTTLKQIEAHLHAPIDLLYIDSKHSRDHVLGNLAIYGQAMRPRFIILDDIHLNPEMENIWAELAATYRERACDVSGIAERACGFGVLEYAGG